MWTSLQRVPAFVLTSMLLTTMAYAGDGGGRGPRRGDRSSTSPISMLFHST
jgi:hypothetical protein